MSRPEPEMLSTLISTAVVTADQSRARSQQSRDGILGMSDLGWCRMKALLVLKQVEPSDPKSIWSAVIGTALGDVVERALKAMFPTWLVGSIDAPRVTYTMKNGAQLQGTPDVVIPDMNAVIDLKSKDGVKIEQRLGASQSNKWQRHGYAKGLIAAGILDDSRPVYVGNAYLDRSGKVEKPLVLIDEMDPALDHEISAWVDDVIYARIHDEEAPRDISASVCAYMCEFFTVCRGGVLPSEESEVFTDEDTLRAIETYTEGHVLETEGKTMKKVAGKVLRGLNGIGLGYQVRTTTINEVDEPGNYRAASERLEVKKLKTPKGVHTVNEEES